MSAFRTLCIAAAVLAFIVITMGAWVRLTDAGLGCPDWPGCFGQLTAPERADELAAAEKAFPGVEVDAGKALREMVHRYAATILGIAILAIAALAWLRRFEPGQPLVAPLLLVPLVIFQGMLGKWTVTLLLQPMVVVLHLLGGLSILSLLVWLALVSGKDVERRATSGPSRLAALALVFLFAQIALGGWTSTNYAALACPDFPTCQAAWWPDADFATAFVPWQPVEGSFEGGRLLHPARVAIHLTHRVGALVVSAVLLWLAWWAFRRGDGAQKRAAGLMLLALAGQIGIGIAIVHYSLPLALGVAHNGTAALLLLTVVLTYFTVHYRRRHA